MSFHFEFSIYFSFIKTSISPNFSLINSLNLFISWVFLESVIQIAFLEKKVQKSHSLCSRFSKQFHWKRNASWEFYSLLKNICIKCTKCWFRQLIYHWCLLLSLKRFLTVFLMIKGNFKGYFVKHLFYLLMQYLCFSGYKMVLSLTLLFMRNNLFFPNLNLKDRENLKQSYSPYLPQLYVFKHTTNCV